MKSVMISIKPKWCELIANGKKTVEVRKTRPKLETPFKCYIYCTDGEVLAYPCFNNPHFHFMRANNGTLVGRRMTAKEREEAEHTFTNKKVIGEFVCDWINEYTAEFTDNDCYEDIRQVWENEDYTYEKDKEFAIVASNEDEDPNNCFLCNASCLSFEDIKKYIGVNFHEIPVYGWHISDLVIYDKPRELSKFRKPLLCHRGIQKDDCVGCFDCEIKRPPQSLCYCELN